MLKHDELLTWFQDLGYIIFDTNKSIDNLQRIRQPSDENEKQVLSIGFFSHFYHQSRFTLMVQLPKIFDKNDNQKRNFIKLFNRLNNDKYDEKLKYLLKSNDNKYNLLFSSKAEIRNAIKPYKIEIEEHSDIIKRVVINRNKTYAHFDPDRDIPFVTDDELELLVKLSNKIFNELYAGFFYHTYAFTLTKSWNVDDIINVLAKYRREEIKRHYPT